MTQAGQEVDAWLSRFRYRQRSDDAAERETAVENGQVRSGHILGLLAEHFDSQFTFGVKLLGDGPLGQLGAAKVESPDLEAGTRRVLSGFPATGPGRPSCGHARWWRLGQRAVYSW